MMLLQPSCHNPITGAVGQAGLLEVPHVTRSATVAGSALAAGIMQCAAWAAVQRGPVALDRITERTLCVIDDDQIAGS